LEKITQKRTVPSLGKTALYIPEMQIPVLDLHLDVNSHPCLLDQQTNVIITISFWIIYFWRVNEV